MSIANPSETDVIRSNSAVTNFLDYYVNPKRPFDYAVMVNGPWGSGKTHLIKTFLKSRPELKPLYVTLNGLSSAEQIDQEFYRQLHPILSSPGMRLAGAAARALAKGALKLDFSKEESGTLNVSLPEIDLTKDLANPRDRLLIFDDLERCKMPVAEVLGYINGFVEHDGLKAIILANENEIRATPENRYDEIREKLIGQTLTVSAPAGDAFDAFVAQVGDKATQGYLKRHKEAVLALHAQGGRGNLRTLKHAMWDFEKIGSQLKQRHWSKEASVLKIMKGVMAVTMEYRAGALSEVELPSLIGNRMGRLLQQQAQKEKSKIDLIEERYPQVDFDQILLSGPMLAAILLRGEMNAPGMVAALDASVDYAKPGERPLWLRATQIFMSSDTAAEDIVREIEEAFTKRAFLIRGEFFQIIGMRLWFAQIGLLDLPPETIVAQAKAYIDDLAANDRLETSLDRPQDTFRENTYGGFLISEWGTDELQSVVEHYDEMARSQEQKRYPEIARELLRQLPIDPDSFLYELAPNAVRAGKYWSHPVLASLSPEAYANAVIAASPDIQSRAIETLHSRHDHHPESLLRPERLWIAKLKDELERQMQHAKPMTHYRLQSLIARNLTPLLPEDDNDGTATIEAGDGG